MYNPFYFKFKKTNSDTDIKYYEGIIRNKTTEISWIGEDGILCTTFCKTELVKKNLKNGTWKPCEYYKSVYKFLKIK